MLALGTTSASQWSSFAHAPAAPPPKAFARHYSRCRTDIAHARVHVRHDAGSVCTLATADDAALIAEYRLAAHALATALEAAMAENERLREGLRTVVVTGVPGGSICARRGDEHKCGWCRGMWTPCPVATARGVLEGTK